MDTNMTVKVLGTGGAVSESSTAFIINDNILVDCGLDIVKNLINDGLIDQIEHVFLTHLHMDHISGLELFIYYLQYTKSRVKIYAGEDFMDFYKSLKCSTDTEKKYYQPFKYTNLKTESTIIIDNTYCNIINAVHMNGSLPCYTFNFFKNSDRNHPKVIISGDIDKPLIMTAEMLENSNIYCFHDMGLTGITLPDFLYRAHPTEQEVYDVFGKTDRIIGVHLPDKAKLQYYKKANKKDYIFTRR